MNIPVLYNTLAYWMLHEKTQYLFPRVYNLNYKYITVSEGVSKSAHAMIHCSSTSPHNTAATLAFPAGERKAPREIRVPVPSLRALHWLQRRWDFTWELLQYSYLVHSHSVHLLHPPLRKAFASFSCNSSQHRQGFIQNKNAAIME